MQKQRLWPQDRGRRPRLLVVLLAAVGSSLAGGAGPGLAQDPTAMPPVQSLRGKCAGLTGIALGGGGRIAGAVVSSVAGGTFGTAEYCAVRIEATDSALKINVVLPLQGWNGRFLETGGGGFKGNLGDPLRGRPGQEPDAANRLRGYVIATSNGGHDATDNTNAAFAMDGVKLTEYTYLAEHRAAVLSKTLIEQFYGRAPSNSYFQGCSTGGHDALMEAMRYPEDFNGIVAGSPAGNFVGLYLQFNRISTQLRKPGAMISTAKQHLLARAVLAQCDGEDGVVDGIISRAEQCRFNPSKLRCAAGRDTGDNCLSDAQIETIEVITSPYTTADGRWSHPGYNFGGEDSPNGWGSYIWPRLSVGPQESSNSQQAAQNTGPSSSSQMSFSDQWVRGFMAHDKNFDSARFDGNNFLPSLFTLGSLWQAFNPDLSGFLIHGGKLIYWNGTMDTSVTPRDASRFYDGAVQTMGQKNTDKVLETFLLPGVGHCGGGPGPSDVDWLDAVTKWVEQGTPPSQQRLVAKKADANTIQDRPVCKYPSYPRYNGSGDPKRASSFVCSGG